LGEGDPPGLAYELLVVQHRLVPGDFQEPEDPQHPLPGVQGQLLVVDGQALGLAHLQALGVHRLHGQTPLTVTLGVPVALHVESRDGHLAADDGVHDRAPVPDHQDELGVGEQARQVEGRLERERVFVAQVGRRLPMLGDYLQDK
ncbi:hypothetical protein EGW08_021873, partial [Elysia chlorotica]